jgi:hypothetical protein
MFIDIYNDHYSVIGINQGGNSIARLDGVAILEKS